MSRDIFAELQEGFGALEQARQDKITLRTYSVEKKEVPSITPQYLLQLRERLNMSRGVFARHLRTNERTLENWEQGRAKPNAQAAVLIRMVAQYPDTVDRLAAI